MPPEINKKLDLTFNPSSTFSLSGENSTPTQEIKLDFTKSKVDVSVLAKQLIKALGCSDIEAINIINKYGISSQEDLNQYIAAENAKKETIESKETFSETTGLNFDFKGFEAMLNDKSINPREKAYVVLEEYAKNRYGEKWDSFSDEEKKQHAEAEVDALLARIDKTESGVTLSKIREYLKNHDNKRDLSERELKVFNDIVKSRMTDLQIANQKGITLEDFYNKFDKNKRNDLKYEFINDLSNKKPEEYKALSLSDRVGFEYENYAILAAQDRFKELGDRTLSPAGLSNLIAKHNIEHPNDKISRASLIYDYLKTKYDNGENLNDIEQKLYEQFGNLNNIIGDLSQIPDFDSTNQAVIEMYESESYQRALKKYSEQGVNNPKQFALKDYIRDYFAKADKSLTKKEVLGSLISRCNIFSAQEVMKVVMELKSEGVITDEDIASNGQAVTSIILGNNKPVNIGASAFKGCDNDHIRTFGTMVAAHNASLGHNDGIIDFEMTYGSIDLETIHHAASKSPDKGKNFFATVVRNRADHLDEYSTSARQNVVATGGAGLYDLDVSFDEIDKYSHDLGKQVDKIHDASLTKTWMGATSTWKGETQLNALQQGKEMAYKFDHDDAVDILKAGVDALSKFEVDNQAKAYDMMASCKEYSEVQEYAASNIHKLDKSVQGEAIRITYETGNEKAISACESQLNQCSGVNPSESTYENYTKNQSIQETISNLDMSKQEDVQKLLDLVDNNSVDISAYLASCSQKDKQAFVEKYCNVANESKLLAFIRQNPSLRGLVLKYAKGLNKEDVFKAVYKGNAGEISKLIKELGLNPIKLANSYKEIAPDIAITTSNSELARNILTNPAQWGYNLGNSATQKLQQIASKANYPDPNENLTKLEPYKA